ncbi:uncharacterized protein LOC129607670 [Condylostylus longicornis]|uniref:uncharacterized protein LOC129607670 n=1 Tax=Condylostylus longicornis TaxID=2530218 RepID=UPI00244E283A|nr:uncharacterized protein LOC129607670 [Condylostylus longicornis]
MAQKGVSPIAILKSIYRNEFQWSIVKSFGLFFLGVKIAQECIGMEVMPSVVPITP